MPADTRQRDPRRERRGCSPSFHPSLELGLGGFSLLEYLLFREAISLSASSPLRRSPTDSPTPTCPPVSRSRSKRRYGRSPRSPRTQASNRTRSSSTGP